MSVAGDFSTNGRTLLTINDRSCYLLGWRLEAMVEIEASSGGCPGLAALELGDEAAVAGLIGRLSPESLYRRFFSPVVRAEQFTRLVLRGVDGHERAAVAAVVDGEVVGVAQYARPAGACRADLAIMVADSWQRQGLGTRMVAALAARATA